MKRKSLTRAPAPARARAPAPVMAAVHPRVAASWRRGLGEHWVVPDQVVGWFAPHLRPEQVGGVAPALVMCMGPADLRDALAQAADLENSLVFVVKRPPLDAWDHSIWEHPKTSAVFLFRERMRLYPVDGIDPGRYRGPSMLVAYGAVARELLVKAVERQDFDGRLMVTDAFEGRETAHG